MARRGAVYYHRAAIPADIKDSYPKAEETFSLKTKDRAEALRLVRVAAVEVDERFGGLIWWRYPAEAMKRRHFCEGDEVAN